MKIASLASFSSSTQVSAPSAREGLREKGRMIHESSRKASSKASSVDSKIKTHFPKSSKAMHHDLLVF